MTPKLKDILEKTNEEIIPDILPVKITSKMSVPTLRALEAIYTLRSWLASESRDINEPAYANLQVQRMWQILKALKTKYRRAKAVNEKTLNEKALNDKIEILSFIDTLEEDLTGIQSPFTLAEATKLELKYGATLNAYQRLRLQIARGGITEARGAEFSELKIDEYQSNQFPMSQLAQRSGTNFPTESIPTLIEEANTAFELGTLTLLEHRLPENLREAIFNRFTTLLTASIQSNDTEETASLIALFPYWNINPYHREKIKELTEQLEEKIAETTARSCSVEGQRPCPDTIPTLPILRLNAIAAEIYTRLDSLTVKYGTHPIPA